MNSMTIAPWRKLNWLLAAHRCQVGMRKLFSGLRDSSRRRWVVRSYLLSIRFDKGMFFLLRLREDGCGKDPALAWVVSLLTVRRQAGLWFSIQSLITTSSSFVTACTAGRDIAENVDKDMKVSGMGPYDFLWVQPTSNSNNVLCLKGESAGRF